jgi:hypothetical protein
MRPGERASKRSSSRDMKPAGRGDRIDVSDRQVQRLVRAFSAIKSGRLRTKILSFAEAVALPRTSRRRQRKSD